MAKYTQDELDEVIHKASRDAAHDAVAVYDEVIEHRFGLVMEALGSIREELDKKVDRDEFNQAIGELKVMRTALADTNQDLHQHDKRITKLEGKVFHA